MSVNITREGNLFIVRAGTFPVARCRSIYSAIAWTKHYYGLR